MYCTHCGNEIDNKAVVCVHCGVPAVTVRQNKVNTQQKPVNGFGIAGFVLSIFSIVLGSIFGVPSLIAFIFGVIGTAGISKCGKGNSLAIAGLIISVLTLMFWGTVWTAYLTGYVYYI